MASPLTGIPDAWSRVAREYRRHIMPDFLPAARTLCEAAGIGAGDLVLDIACGPGTATFVAHELGASRVVGVDFARAMIALAEQETPAGAAVHFALGDALRLPLSSGRFDVVISSFGLVFASDPIRAASEAARVLGPGGRLGLLAWAPDGTVDAYQQLAFRYLEIPPGTHNPSQWGVPAQARAWLERFRDVELLPLEVPFRAESPAAAWRILRTATGRIAASYAALDAPARRCLDTDMEAFFQRFGGPRGEICWDREALVVRGVRR
jgi:ubiquinone/menaquinone biosynthesis C-methylase UbiE